jgi:dephospho-CoA kinase
MLKVALTGGIACGKSYSLREFAKLGVFPIDADVIARDVVEPDRPAYLEVVKVFGDEYIDPEGKLDRKKLAHLIFSDDTAREKLNELLHPYIFVEEQKIRDSLEYDLSNFRPQICMTDAALVVETGWHRKYDVVIVVYCREEIQLRRLMYRDRIPQEEALKRIASQMPLLEKILNGDYIIENSGRLSDTNEQIHHTYSDMLTKLDGN